MKKITDMEKLNIENKFSESSDAFYPDASLKQRIVEGARDIQNSKPKREGRVFSIPKFAAAVAAIVILIAVVLGGFGFQNEKYMNLYIDVNPSIELSLNRFGIVNGVTYINPDAELCFKSVNLKGKTSKKAIEKIIDILASKGFLDNDAEMYLSGYSSKKANITKKLEKLQNHSENYKKNKNFKVIVGKNNFSENDKNMAQNYGLSPMKYAIIAKIIALDNSYTVDDLKNKSMKQLAAIYQELESNNSIGNQHRGRQINAFQPEINTGATNKCISTGNQPKGDK